jgi:hypothetical protein
VREAEAARAGEPDFALVTVENEAVERGGGLVELVLGDVTVRVGPDVSTERITEIVRAIRAA